MRVPKSVARAAFMIGSAAIVALAAWGFGNTSGHTSIDPALTLIVFLPVLITGLVYRYAGSDGRRGKLWGTLAVFAGLAGILLLLYLDWSCTLLQYETWIERGMP